MKPPNPLRFYGALKLTISTGFYKYFIPTGLMCSRNFGQKTKGACYTEKSQRHGVISG